MNAAIRAVHATIPSAIHDELDPMVSRGLRDVAADVLSLPELKLATTAAPSTRIDPINSHVIRLMGVRVSLRSVKYQCPSSSPSSTAPVKSAPASSWKTASHRARSV